MDADRAQILLELLGCDRIRVRGSEIHASCPFDGNHWRGDRRPSFSAKIKVVGRSPYFCFSCHESGTLEGLAIRHGHENLVPDWKPKKLTDRSWLPGIGKTKKLERKPVFFDERLLNPFVGRVHRYILDRGITLETAKAWELGVDREGRRATFVLRDIDGRLAMMSGRDLTGKSVITYTNYVCDKRYHRFRPFKEKNREADFVGPTKMFFLFGEYHAMKVRKEEVKRCSSDLIVVEGQMDVLTMWQRGWNVVGVTGSYPSRYQVEKLVKLLSPDGRVVAMMDGDDAGRKCAEELGQLIGEQLPYYVASLDEGCDPDSIKEEEVESVVKKARLFNLTRKT